MRCVESPPSIGLRPAHSQRGSSRVAKPHFLVKCLGMLVAALGLAACGGGDSGTVYLPEIPQAPAPEPDPGSVPAVCSTAFDRAVASTGTMARSGGAVLQAQPALATAATGNVNLSDCKRDKDGNVTIGEGFCGPNVVIDQSFTRERGNALGVITIEKGGLAVPELLKGELKIETTGIVINDGGLLSIGTPECRIGNADDPEGRVTMTFLNDPSKRIDPVSQSDGSKGIAVHGGGTLRLYGAKGVQDRNGGVNWTHLSQPAGPAKYQSRDEAAAPVSAGGDTTLHLAKDVRGTKAGYGWQAGDWIVVATSSFSPFESEFVQIDAIEAGANDGSIVRLKQPLRHYHFGGADPGKPGASNYGAGAATNFGVDERSEVGLISRSIRLTAETPAVDTAQEKGVAKDPAQHWGGEIMIMEGFKEVHIQGVELEKFGKARRGSYPIHFHLAGNAAGKDEHGNPRHLVDSNSIHHSYNKCVTVHKTQNLSVTNNVCARAVGHLFYQEIAQETGGEFRGNLGIGAMSHYFGLDEKLPKAEGNPQLVRGWWEGDNLVRQAGYNYNGLNVPNRDDPSNPMGGHCYAEPVNGRLDPSVPTIQKVPSIKDAHDPDVERICPSGWPVYVEPASGFWIGNPGTILEGNSIAGCQGIGKGYWYVPPKSRPSPRWNGKPPAHEPVGRFLNNRVHACYDGLFGEEHKTLSEQLFPTVDGVGHEKNLIGRFDGLTATRIRNRGVWVRPVWYSVENGRFATNRDAVTLVTSGGLDGNAPGAWGLLKDSVLVGLSTNNVDRWGPCADLENWKHSLNGQGCVDFGGASEQGTNSQANEYQDKGYQTPFWNSAGYMIYDGPVRIVRNHFVNYRKDISTLLTKTDLGLLNSYKAYPNALECGSGKDCYEGDAALGWFQSNQSAYPTATVTKGLSYDNVDFRHQIYTEYVNLAAFKDGDKNTAVIDLDGTLTGYRIVDEQGQPVPHEFPISLNNLPFNRNGNAVDECLATGQQDEKLEGRATSLISPANMATLEFEALARASGGASRQIVPNQWQDMLFTKDSLDAGEHQSMQLQSRNNLGVWEPKVASGASYSVRALASTSPEAPGATVKGMPWQLQVGLTDAVKSRMNEKPFHVRVGICYSGANGKPPANDFTVVRGYKSWGGNGVNYNDSAMKPYFNRYDGGSGLPTCFNLDMQNPAVNLKNPVEGKFEPAACPAQGVIPQLEAGGCPAGAVAEGKQCLFKTQSYRQAASIAELTKPDGTPAAMDKYFYDAASGMLYFYVVQDSPNAVGVAPLGSCKGLPGDDPACPGKDELETYYGCPPQGCTTVMVTANDPAYVPGEAKCDALSPGGSIYGAGSNPGDSGDHGLKTGKGGYTVPEPVITNRLAYADTGVIVRAIQETNARGVPYWIPEGNKHPASCSATTTIASAAASTTRLARADAPRALELASLRANVQAPGRLQMQAPGRAWGGGLQVLADGLWTDLQALVSRVLRAAGVERLSRKPSPPDIGALAPICTAAGPQQPQRLALVQ